MASWAATSIRKAYPDAFLCWAVETRCASVVDSSVLCSQIARFPRDEWRARRWCPSTWRAQLGSFARLRRLRFDFGFDFQGHSKTALCLRFANPSRRIAAKGTDALARRLNPVAPGLQSGMHVVEENQHVLSILGEFQIPTRPIFPVVRHAPSERLVTISVSAGRPEKAYEARHWAEVASRLIEQGFRIEFLGGKSDSPIDVEGSTDSVGKLTLLETMERVSRSTIHLAADTGTGHMAAAMGVPVVSVFGPTDPARFRPYTTRGIVLRSGSGTADTSPNLVLQAANNLMEVNKQCAS